MRVRTLAFALLVLVALPTCTVTQHHGGSVQYPAANLNSDTYQPGSGWQLVWSDEFDGDALDRNNWTRQVVKAGRFNKEWQRYTDSEKNAYVENSCLVIKAIHESNKHGLDQYTSARLHTAQKHAWQYGKIAARVQLPHGQGIWPAFWMLGDNIDENGGDTPWPASGEIDIMELYGSKSDAAIEANIHYADNAGKNASMGAEKYSLPRGKFADRFHVFELQWDKNTIAWSVDGRRFASTSITGDELSEFHNKFFLLLNIAVGGQYAGRPDSTTEFPQYMYVDWVRVYKRPSMQD
ncbi:MAG: glycoside hydrolase family 16 protein [Pseudomonadales bacterium]|nr:glycoside hydrolase family 16 protein [Pseudomonadales bacterium]